MNIFHVCCIFLVFTATKADDPDDICQSCECSVDAQILNVNCANKSLNHVGGRWSTTNTTKFVKISFFGNNMPTLEPIPATNATVEIILSQCNIQYLRPKLFADAKNVKFVDLSHNLLKAEEVSSEKFQGPYSENTFAPIATEHLDLSYNQIHSLEKNVFEHMPNLKYLNLEGNDFTVLDIHTQLAISSIRQLQNLNLANNELTEMIGDAIVAHDNLTRLDLSNNLLDFVPKSLTKIGGSLQVLILDENPIIEFVSDTFLGLDNIIELSANKLSKLKFVNANTFATMPKLKKLSLTNNYELVDIDREAFGPNQTLEEFRINNNNLDRIDYKLLPWSKLHVFEFDENPLDCSCDLYNITIKLPADITRREDGPFCLDPRTERYLQVFKLKSDICLHQEHSTHRDVIERHFSVMRFVLFGLSLIATIVGLLIIALALIKYIRHRRESSYPYASQIAYNPVATSVSKY